MSPPQPPTPPRSLYLPSLPERPEAGHRRDGPAKHSTWLWVWGQQKSRSLQGPSASTHTHTPHSTHTSGGRGKHTVVPAGEVRRQGLRFLRATLPFFPSLSSTSPPSPLLQATSCTCDTTDSLMLHYTYTSLSLSAPLRAMFPDVASKLGHEHDTRRHRKRMEVGAERLHFVPHCLPRTRRHQVERYMCCRLSRQHV